MTPNPTDTPYTPPHVASTAESYQPLTKRARLHDLLDPPMTVPSYPLPTLQMQDHSICSVRSIRLLNDTTSNFNVHLTYRHSVWPEGALKAHEIVAPKRYGLDLTVPPSYDKGWVDMAFYQEPDSLGTSFPGNPYHFIGQVSLHIPSTSSVAISALLGDKSTK